MQLIYLQNWGFLFWKNTGQNATSVPPPNLTGSSVYAPGLPVVWLLLISLSHFLCQSSDQSVPYWLSVCTMFPILACEIHTSTAWFIVFPDRCAGLQLKLWNLLTTRALPQRSPEEHYIKRRHLYPYGHWQIVWPCFVALLYDVAVGVDSSVTCSDHTAELWASQLIMLTKQSSAVVHPAVTYTTNRAP